MLHLASRAPAAWPDGQGRDALRPQLRPSFNIHCGNSLNFNELSSTVATINTSLK
jgi:hypothetical protein